MRRRQKQWVASIAMTAIMCGQVGVPLAYASQSQSNDRGDGKKSATESPIKHVIVLIGENRTFDNVYGTYLPKRSIVDLITKGPGIENLLTNGIVNADGSPGPNKDAARQFQIGTINPVSYFISTNNRRSLI